MNRRSMIRKAIGIGVGGGLLSIDAPDYFADWEQEHLTMGTHYWRREGTVCYEYKDFEDCDIVLVYTIKRVGELDEMITRQTVRSREDAIRLISDIRSTISL